MGNKIAAMFKKGGQEGNVIYAGYNILQQAASVLHELSEHIDAVGTNKENPIPYELWENVAETVIQRQENMSLIVNPAISFYSLAAPNLHRKEDVIAMKNTVQKSSSVKGKNLNTYDWEPMSSATY